MLALSILVACSSTSSAAPVPVPVAATTQDSLGVLAAKRAQLIGWLHDYREAGVFPTDAAGMPNSVFIDAKGIRCPMAELLHKAGRDDLVAAVAKEANTVRLADVHSGPLHDWMLGSGLTQQEIALVQGVMNISMDWMEIEQPREHEQILASKAAVRAKLEVTEMALRDNTGTSLAILARRVPARASIEALASAPVRGSVLPATAVSRAPVASPQVKASRRVVMRRGFQVERAAKFDRLIRN
ncbi:MAG: hypothetical protein H0T46_37890 [Deltaproteobacteria bacterium]|nr:hypothetical protein [Deltaproteobacteria bacterium]